MWRRKGPRGLNMDERTAREGEVQEQGEVMGGTQGGLGTESQLHPMDRKQIVTDGFHTASSRGLFLLIFKGVGVSSLALKKF